MDKRAVYMLKNSIARVAIEMNSEPEPEPAKPSDLSGRANMPEIQALRSDIQDLTQAEHKKSKWLMLLVAAVVVFGIVFSTLEITNLIERRQNFESLFCYLAEHEHRPPPPRIDCD